MRPRRNARHGHDVLQFYDANTLLGSAYTYANRPLIHGAKYGWTLDSHGVPVFKIVAGSRGPIGGWVKAPPTGARKVAQWAQLFPAKVTTTSPLKVTPIKDVSGSPFNVDATLAEITATGPTGYTPALGDVGVLCQGTDLAADQLIFFPCSTTGGGSAGGAPGIWGDASDGNLALDGVTGHFLFSSAGTLGRLYGIDTEAMTGLGSGNTDPLHYYLNRDVYADTITLSANVVLHTAGWRLWALAVVGPASSIIDFSPHHYYQAARPGTGTGWTQTGFNTGGGQSFTVGMSGNGGNLNNQGFAPAMGVSLQNGTYRFFGRGGDGGAGATQPGGWRNTIPPVINLTTSRSFPDAVVYLELHGGAGGGGGSQAQGGAGGGVQVATVRDLSGFAGLFRAEGSPGGPATSGVQTGAGGGGGGQQRITTLIDGPYTTSVAGGAGGVGFGGGANGSPGQPGLCVRNVVV